MSNMRERALQKLEEAIAEMQKVPNFNVGFTYGAVLGMAGAYMDAEVITWEDYKMAQERSAAIHDHQIKIMTRTGHGNSILPGDESPVIQ